MMDIMFHCREHPDCTLWPRRHCKHAEELDFPGGVVYVVGEVGFEDTERSVARWKIGFTTNPISDRMAAFRTGCPVDLQVYFAFVAPFEVEGWLHGRFRKKRHHGEWFDLDNADRFELAALAAAFDVYSTERAIRVVADAHARLRDEVASVRFMPWSNPTDDGVTHVS